MALTEQEQKDLDLLEGMDFKHKFSQQLNLMSANQHSRVSTWQEQKDELSSTGGEAIFKAEIRSSYDKERFYGMVDENGDDLALESGESLQGEKLDAPVSPTSEELDAIEVREYDKKIARLVDSITNATEQVRLIGVEQDFRSRGIVSRTPIGTTYFQSYEGNDSWDGTSKSVPWKYLNRFTEDGTRAQGDIMICRRIRGGFDPQDLVYSVHVDGTEHGGATAQQAISSVIPNEVTNQSNVIKMPKYIIGSNGEWGDNERNNSVSSWSDDNGFMRPEIARCTDPRDRSTMAYFYNRKFSLAEGYSDRIDFSAGDGSAEKPVVVMADYENEWGDFIECANGKNGDDDLNGADTTANNARGGGYVVELGSKIIRRTHDGTLSHATDKQKIPVHSQITPGDWIFIGELTSGSNPRPNVSPGVCDDPYEYSYMVRDVNYDKIVLWHPYKGEMAGEKRTVVSMGYAPRWRTMGYGSHTDDYHHSGNDTYGIDCSSAVHWVFQGISFYNSLFEYTSADHPERRKLMHFSGDNHFSFKDCFFQGGQRHDETYGWMNRTDALWYVSGQRNTMIADKCVFSNSKMGIYEYYSANTSSRNQQNQFRIKDCIFNGWAWDRVIGAKCEYHWDANWNGVNNQYDKMSCRIPASGITSENGNSSWEITDCEFVNHSLCHIWMNDSTQCKIRNPIFLGAGMDFVDPTVNTIYEAHENLGVRWARPAFAGAVNNTYPGTAQTNGGDPQKGMNDVTNGTVASIVGTQACKKINSISGLWTADTDYGRKFYPYITSDIPDSEGGYTGNIDNANDIRSYHDLYQGDENSGASQSGDSNTAGARHSYRRIGTACNTSGWFTQYSNWYTSHRRNDYFNRYDGSTHKYRFVQYFGATALYGATDVTPGTGRLHCEDGLEKWNSWWCTSITNPWGHASPIAFDEDKAETYLHVTSGGHKCPKGQPMGDELFMEYHWWCSRYSNNHWWYTSDGGQHNAYNNTTYNDQARPYEFGNSNRFYCLPPYGNISVHASDEWGTETGNGPGSGIGHSPFFGPVMTYYPNYYAYESNWMMAGSHSTHENLAVQDYYHLYMNYDKDNLGRGNDLYPEVFHPMIKGSRKGESAGISKNIIFDVGNKTHPWSNVNNTTANNNDVYTRAIQKQRYPHMETMGQAYDDDGNLATILRSGGGSYVIKVFPTERGYKQWANPDTTHDLAGDGHSKQFGRWDDSGLLRILEYPFYLSTNARTYTVYLNRGLRSAGNYTWSNDPTSDDVFLEMEYFASKPSSATLGGDRYMEHAVRRKDRSGTGLTFSSGSGGWEALALTVTPETEGVGYLRLWWGKAKEAGKANTFYVDPKVEVT